MSKPWWRSLVGRASLLGGVLALVTLIGPRMPHEQELAFNLGKAEAQQLEVSWTPESEVEAQGGFSLNLAAKPSRIVRHTAELPNGSYRFDIVVTPSPIAPAVEAKQASNSSPTPSASTTTYVRRVTLEGGPTTIHLP
ncbi:MAG: hypothetical protein SFV15_16935 [Polyangiaceae bacterium]|nr:hypothetical protein [Polyangiaceae bacterium]